MYTAKVKQILHDRFDNEYGSSLLEGMITKAEENNGQLQIGTSTYLLDKGGNFKLLGRNEETGYRSFASVKRENVIEMYKESQKSWFSQIKQSTSVYFKSVALGLASMVAVAAMPTPSYALSEKAMTLLSEMRARVQVRKEAEKKGYRVTSRTKNYDSSPARMQTITIVPKPIDKNSQTYKIAKDPDFLLRLFNQPTGYKAVKPKVKPPYNHVAPKVDSPFQFDLGVYADEKFSPGVVDEKEIAEHLLRMKRRNFTPTVLNQREAKSLFDKIKNPWGESSRIMLEPDQEAPRHARNMLEGVRLCQAVGLFNETTPGKYMMNWLDKSGKYGGKAYVDTTREILRQEFLKSE